MAEKKVTDRIDIYQLAGMFKLPNWNDIEENNFEYVHGAGHSAAMQAKEGGETEKQIEKTRNKAEEDAHEEIYRNYHASVMSAADELFGLHHLELVPIRKNDRYPFEYRIEPASGKTWSDAAKQLATTINGVGLTYEDPSEYGKTPKKYVLSRIGWVSQYPEVYGTASAKRIYERSWR